jgi:hypothetical protein
MIRSLLLISALSLMCLLLTACGNGGSSSNTPAGSGASDAPVEPLPTPGADIGSTTKSGGGAPTPPAGDK